MRREHGTTGATLAALACFAFASIADAQRQERRSERASLEDSITAEPEPELVAGAGPETEMATDPAGSESGPETADRDPDAENGAPNAEDGDPAVSAESDLPRGVDPPETEAAAMAESAMTPTTTESAMTPTMTESAMAAAPVQVNVACIPWGEVWVGQRYMGRAPVQLRLEPGTHTIRAGAGSPQFTKRVRVRPGRRRMNVTFDLDALIDAPLTLSRGHLVSLGFDRATAARTNNDTGRRIDLRFRARVEDVAP